MKLFFSFTKFITFSLWFLVYLVLTSILYLIRQWEPFHSWPATYWKCRWQTALATFGTGSDLTWYLWEWLSNSSACHWTFPGWTAPASNRSSLLMAQKPHGEEILYSGLAKLAEKYLPLGCFGSGTSPWTLVGWEASREASILQGITAMSMLEQLMPLKSYSKEI